MFTQVELKRMKVVGEEGSLEDFNKRLSLYIKRDGIGAE